MDGRRFPYRACADAVVEEDHECASPVEANRDRTIPAPWSLHLVSREVKGIDLRFGEIVAAGNVALLPRFREPRWRLDEFLFPGPRDDRTQLLASLVGSAAWISTFMR